MNFKSPSKTIVSAAVASATLLIAGVGNAQLVVTDFNGNTAGQLQGQNGSLSTGLTGTWAGVTTNSVIAGNLTNPFAVSQTGTAQMLTGTSTNSASARNYINLATSLDGTVYFSFLAQLLETNDRVGISFTQGSNNDSSGSGYNVILIGGASNGTLAYRQNSVVPSGGSTTFGSQLDTQFIVGRIDFEVSATLDRIQLWLNPDLSSGDLPVTPTITSTAYNIGTEISTIGAFSYGSGAGNQGYLDNIRFGTSLSAVAVPEPSSVMLIFGGGFALLAAVVRRSRKS